MTSPSRGKRLRTAPRLVGLAPLMLVVGVLAAPGSAQAAVNITDERVVVSTSQARAVVSRKPFRLRIQDGAGRTVLSEVANTGQAPLVEPPTVDPEPFGLDNLPETTLYAPLAFTVGEETIDQYDGGVWGGNLTTAERHGIQYSARNVVSATREGAGARLVLSTSDPSGRRIVLTVRPRGERAIRVSARPTPSGGVALMGDSFSSRSGEGFFGFGGRHNAIDQRGNDFESFVQQQNVDAAPFREQIGLAPGTGGDRYLYPNGPEAAYYVQAQFISSRSYGFLLDRFELARFRMASDRPDAWNVTASAPGIDYLVAPGAPPRAIRTLTALTGRHRVPPDWVLGSIFDRGNRNIGESEENYEQNVRDDLKNIDRYELPLSAYRIEGWSRFVDPATLRQFIAELRKRDIHPLVYFQPWARPGDEAVDKGYVAKRSDGTPYFTSSTTFQPIAMIDFTNRAAVRWWQKQVTDALDLGADGFMQDFGEQVQLDMHFADGSTGRTMHNRYLNLYHRATRQAFDRYEREHPGRELWFFTRAGYSGLPGSAAYEGGNFPGDETTDWSRSSGIASLTTDMLSRGVGGAFGFTTDIGGYFDYNTPPTTAELFIRWAEWAALSPIFRLHGSGRTGTHTPWQYGIETVRLYKRLTRLHLEARPLIARLWREAEETGMPVARPLWVHYPDDARARAEDQQWLLGPDVLVAPVVVEGARSRNVYFPEGCWRSPETGRRFEGPTEATVSAPLDRLPYYFRCGTTPFGRVAGRGQEPGGGDRDRNGRRREAGVRTRSRGAGAGAAAASGGGEIADDSGSLPFTGWQLIAVVATGLALLGAGRLLRGGASRR